MSEATATTDGVTDSDGGRRRIVRIIGVLGIIGGIVLIVAGAVTGQPALMMAGAAMAIGGAVMMLSPQPSAAESADSANNRSSYAFNGPVNTEAQGNPVPLLYGELIVGSAVISGGVYVEDRA